MKQRIKFFAIFALLGGVLCVQEARAAYDIFMQIDGIPGESIDQNHAGWNDVFSFSHGMSKTTNTLPNHADFSISKRLDKSSTTLNYKLNRGDIIPKITVDFQKSSGIEPVVFYKVVLEDVYVTSVSSKGSAGDDMVYDNVSVNYSRITWTYFPIDPKTGKVGSPITSMWDLKTNKGS